MALCEMVEQRCCDFRFSRTQSDWRLSKCPAKRHQLMCSLRSAPVLMHTRVNEISPQKIALASPLVTTSSCRYQAECPFTLIVWLQWQPLRPPCLKQTSLLPQRVEFITVRQCRVVKPATFGFRHKTLFLIDVVFLHEQGSGAA